MRWDYVVIPSLSGSPFHSFYLPLFEPFGICNWFEPPFSVLFPPLPWFFCVALSLWTRMMMLAFQRSDHFPSLGMLLLSYVLLLSLIYTQSCSVVRGIIMWRYPVAWSLQALALYWYISSVDTCSVQCRLPRVVFPWFNFIASFFIWYLVCPYLILFSNSRKSSCGDLSFFPLVAMYHSLSLRQGHINEVSVICTATLWYGTLWSLLLHYHLCDLTHFVF